MGAAAHDGGKPGSGSGLINPAEFPCRARYLDTEAIRESAGVLRTYAENLTGHMDTIAANWNGLIPHYVAPESWRVLNLMGPAQHDANTVADVYGNIAGKLDTYADELDAIKPLLAEFEQRAWDFRNEVKDGVETSVIGEVDTWVKVVSPAALILDATTQGTRTVAWNEHGPTVEKNNDLLREYAGLLEQVSMSASSAANAIRRCHDFTSGIFTPAPYGGATSDQIMATPNPWGEPVAEDRSVLEQITDGVGDFGGGLVFGVTSMVGYHPDAGWSWDTFTGTWTGIGNMAQVAGSVATNPANAVFLIATAGQTFDIPGSHLLPSTSMDGRIDYVEKMGPVWSGLVGYDQQAEDGWHQWKDEPYRMGTGVLLNIGTCFIPGAGGAGAAAKTATGARLANAAVHTADVLIPFGGQAVKGGLGVWRGGVNLVKGEAVAAGAIRGGLEGITHTGVGAAGRADTAGLNNTVTSAGTGSGRFGQIDLGPINKPTGLPEGILSPKGLHDYPIHYGPAGPPSRSINIDHIYPPKPAPHADNPVGAGHGSTPPETPHHATPDGVGKPSPDDPRSLLWRDQPARPVEPTAAQREAGQTVTTPEHAAVPEPELATVGAKPGHVTAEQGGTVTNSTTTTGSTSGGGNHGTHTTSGGSGNGSTTGGGPGDGNFRPPSELGRNLGSGNTHATTGGGDVPNGGADGGLPEGPGIHEPSGRAQWDPDGPVRETVDPAALGQEAPTETQMWQARQNAPVNEFGQPVDHRTGMALGERTADGQRGWHAVADKETGELVAENIDHGPAHDAHPYRPDGTRAPGDPASFGTSASTDYRTTWRDAHPEYDHRRVWVHHAVEQRVLKEYPGVVTPSEIHSLDNLRGIPSEVNREVHLQQIRILWNQFYAQIDTLGRVPTRQELLDWVTIIDDNLGHNFLPPER